MEIPRILLVGTTLACTFFLSLTSGSAAAEVEPMLASNAEVVSIVEGLGPNQSARLPDFAVVGDGLDAFESFATRGPGVRDFSRKWVYADSRGRALYSAGNHGAPHKFNDVWEYDLGSNTWVMLHAPDVGVTPSHTWWGLTYDQERERMLWMAPTGGIGEWDTGGYEGPPLRSYDSYAQSGWNLTQTSPSIRISLAGTLEYLRGRDVVLWYGNQWNGSGLQQLDIETNTWTELLSVNDVYFDNPDAPPAEAVITYNTVNDVLVGAHGNSVYVYDFGSNAWSKVLAEVFPAHVSDNSAAFEYDSINDIHLIHVAGELFAYHFTTNTLETLSPVGGVPKETQTMAYFDSSYGVFVIYDETPNPWVYRYGGSGNGPASTPDAGPSAHADAGSGPNPEEVASDSACGCRTNGSSSTPLFLVFALMFIFRKSKKRIFHLR